MSPNADQKTISLNIYGFRVGLQTSLADSAIRHEFSYFSSENRDFHLRIQQSPLRKDRKLKKGIWIGRSRMCDVYQAGFSTRIFVYKNKDGEVKGYAQFRSDKNEIQIYTNCEDLFFEVIYIMILSLSGEYLEKKKLMRLHAMSFQKDQKTFCIWGLRKAGKSTLAQSLIDQDSAQIFSDETSLYDLESGNILPFPVRIALEQPVTQATNLVNSRTPSRQYLDTKVMYDVPAPRIAKAAKLTHFLILKPGAAQNTFLSADPTDRFLFFPQLVLGVGLIQMWEYLVRPDNMAGLLKILFHRIQLYFHLQNKRLLIWKRTADRTENWMFFQNRILKGFS